MIPQVGQRLGPYEILGRLGGGGMGLVFRGWDERLHREVAIKLLHDEYKLSAMRLRFLQEARAASSLNHPNICTVFDIGEQDGDPYLVMELLEGETLRDRIARNAMPVEEIVRYAGEIADALTVAHAKGIVHRDIKPANIFLVPMANGRSQAKVLDFGLAKIGLEMQGGWKSRALDLTLAGATVGTLSYMSPEQARGESLDARSDLFSLGIVLYEMATRQVPFRGETSAIMFLQLFNHDPEPVRNWNQSVPRGLERIILKLLAKDRRNRFQSATELCGELLQLERKIAQRGWMQGGTTAAVPLVRASDPVARRRRLRGTEVDAGARDSSSANRVAVGQQMLEAAASAVKAAISGERPAEKAPEAVVEKQAAAISESAVVEAPAAMPAVKERTARLHAGATQFEYGADENSDAKLEATLASIAFRPRFVEADLDEPAARSKTLVALMVTTVVLAGVALFTVRSQLFRPVVMGAKDRLILTVVDNKTDDAALGGAVKEGLEIELRQSGTLNVMDDAAYTAGKQQVEGEKNGEASDQRIAQKVGAKVYVYTELEGRDPYTIHAEIVRTDTNDRIASLEEEAETRNQIPAALGRLAVAVRKEISSDSRKELKADIPLENEATGNVEALADYAAGLTALNSGDKAEAIRALQMAVGLDARFTQAHMMLAWLYRSEGAELASSAAAEHAREGADRAGDRVKMLAEFCWQMNASGNLPHAAETIRDFVARYPTDADGMMGLAMVLQAQGYLPESLLAAQQGYGEDPYDGAIYREAETALIGMDRFDSALQVDRMAGRLGVLGNRNLLVAEYLDGRDDQAAKNEDRLKAALDRNSPGGGDVSLAAIDGYARYLDSTGRLTEGLTVWRAGAVRAAVSVGLDSAAASMIARATLDHAIAEDCGAALMLAEEAKGLSKGPVASFNAAVGAALCGDLTYSEKAVAEMQERFPLNTAVKEYYVPEIQAAGLIGANHPGDALTRLTGLEQFDQVSMGPYLRGLAHTGLGQSAAAEEDFQLVLKRRGLSMGVAASMYPMAQFEMARAYAATGDSADSVEDYKRFAAMWVKADKAPQLTEAVLRSK